jgi:hypothetical protein
MGTIGNLQKARRNGAREKGYNQGIDRKSREGRKLDGKIS